MADNQHQVEQLEQEIEVHRKEAADLSSQLKLEQDKIKLLLKKVETSKAELKTKTDEFKVANEVHEFELRRISNQYESRIREMESAQAETQLQGEKKAMTPSKGNKPQKLHEEIHQGEETLNDTPRFALTEGSFGYNPGSKDKLSESREVESRQLAVLTGDNQVSLKLIL